MPLATGAKVSVKNKDDVKMMSEEEKQREAIEYVSMLLSVQLAVAFNKSKPNRAIRRTLKAVIERTDSEAVKWHCRQGIKSFFPMGWMAEEMNNISRRTHYTKEAFIEIGVSLEEV